MSTQFKLELDKTVIGAPRK